MGGPGTLLVLGLCAALLLMGGTGRLQISLAAVFFGVFLLPSVLYGTTPLDSLRVGIAGAEPRLMTYTVAMAGILAFATLSKRVSISWSPVVPLVAYVVLWTVLFWPASNEVRAGAVHLVTGASAWAAGSAVSSLVKRHPAGPQRLLLWILGWAAFEALVSLAQGAGSSIYPLYTGPTEDSTLTGRIGGSLGHPSTIGKVIFLLVMLALPWLSSADRGLRRRAAIAMALMVIPLVLSGGRANAAATVAMVVLALVLEPGPRRWSRRLRLAAVIIAAGLLSAGFWVQRFETGENGSTRAHFTEVALRFMKHHWDWVTGIGPNSYVSKVGPYDALTAQGWPVHNFYLLAAVEMGLIGAVVLAWPFAKTLVAGWRGRRLPGIRGAQARVLVAGFPGMLMITLTGWGMMSAMFPAWLFTMGYCVDQVDLRSRVRLRPKRSEPYHLPEPAVLTSPLPHLGAKSARAT